MTSDWGLVAELQFRKKSKAQNFNRSPIARSVLPDLNECSEVEDCGGEDWSEKQKLLMKHVLRSQLLDNLVDDAQNTNSIYRTGKTFEQFNIKKDLIRGVYALGFNVPTEIQVKTLPTLMANPPVNMIAQSQNGTGKTAAFLLASLSRVDTKLQYPQVLIISPTYELAVQTGEVARKIAKFCPDISFCYAVKGETFLRGQTLREHVVIGTPGKIFDWGRRHKIFDLKKIRVFVLDEADVMISTQGHQDQCIRIHRELCRDRDKCQMLLFSATYTPEVMDFAEQIIPDPIIIRLRREEETLHNVHQFFIQCSTPEEKYDALCNIYGSLSIGQTIVFCRRKTTAAWLGSKLLQDGHSIGYSSSDLTVDERLGVLTTFREGKEKILITTNVFARGIDIEQVTVVINFDLPLLQNGCADCETYLHRIGRSGRFGKTGFAINFVSTPEDFEVLAEIESHFSMSIRRLDLENLENLEHMI